MKAMPYAKCKRMVVRYAKGEESQGEAIQMEVPRMLKMTDATINTLSRDVQGTLEGVKLPLFIELQDQNRSEPASNSSLSFQALHASPTLLTQLHISSLLHENWTPSCSIPAFPLLRIPSIPSQPPSWTTRSSQLRASTQSLLTASSNMAPQVSA